jgi:hypothetical protein
MMQNHTSSGSMAHRDWLVGLLCDVLGNSIYAPILPVCRHNPCVFFENMEDFRQRAHSADTGGVAAKEAVGGPAAVEFAGGNTEVGAAGGNAAVQASSNSSHAAVDSKACAEPAVAAFYLKVGDISIHVYMHIYIYTYIYLGTCLHAHRTHTHDVYNILADMFGWYLSR